MPTPSLIIPSAPVYDEGLLYGLNVYGTQFAPEAIPFTRATTATRTNSAGLVELVPYNLLQYSEMFADAWWVKTGSSITANTITAPNGTLTADTIIESTSTGDHKVYKVFSFSSGNTYTLSIYAKKKERNLIYLFDAYTARGTIFNLDTSATTSIGAGLINANIVSVGDGWYRCSGSVTIAISGNFSFEAGITNTTSSISYTGDGTSGAYFWGAQLVEGTSALPYLKTETRLNRPRVDFSLGGCPNLLLEPQRTNLLLQSSSFDNATWTKGASTVTANSTTSPSGIVDADTFAGDGTFAQHQIHQLTTITSGLTYTTSIYAKKNTNNFIQIYNLVTFFGSNVWANFDLNNGVIGSVGSAATASITSVGNGWYRCTITGTAIASGAASTSYFHLVTSATAARGEANSLSTSVFLWGAQLEQGAYETSYIPTTTTSVTRNADSFTDSNIFSRGMITAAGGTWFVELRNSRSLTRDAFSASLGIGNTFPFPSSGLYLAQGGGVSTTSIRKLISGVETTLFTIATGTVKLAIKWNGSTADVFQNGVKVVSATAFTPTALEFLFGNGNDIPKYIQQMALYPTPLSDSELISLTTL